MTSAQHTFGQLLSCSPHMRSSHNGFQMLKPTARITHPHLNLGESWLLRLLTHEPMRQHWPVVMQRPSSWLSGTSSAAKQGVQLTQCGNAILSCQPLSRPMLRIRGLLLQMTERKVTGNADDSGSCFPTEDRCTANT